MNRSQKERFISEAAIICPLDDEAMRIDYVYDGNVYVIGEESGEDYVIDINDVDFENSIFYKLQKMEIPQCQTGA